MQQEQQKTKNQPLYDTIIIGAGFSGLSAAYHLCEQRRRCVVIDPNPSLGGLVASHKFDTFSIEKFYHHLQRRDDHTAEMMQRLGIGHLLKWLPASNAYLADNRLYPLNNPLDILCFQLLSLKDKWRLAQLVRNVDKIDNLNEIDDLSVEEWITKTSSADVYRNFFAPLIHSKFGKEAANISAAWMVGRIRFRSHRSLRGETLGYVVGGFQQLVDALHSHLQNRCQFFMQQRVLRISRNKAGIFTVQTGTQVFQGRSVITTISPKTLLEIIDWPDEERQRLQHLPFQKVICVTLGIRHKVHPYYWCNIANPEVSFAVLLEHTNFYRDPHYPPALLYLANYCSSEQDFIWQMQDDEIVEAYKLSLNRFFAVKDADILWWKLARADAAGLIYRRGILKQIPAATTSIAGLYTIGLMRSFPERSINDSIKQGHEAATLANTYLGPVAVDSNRGLG